MGAGASVETSECQGGPDDIDEMFGDSPPSESGGNKSIINTNTNNTSSKQSRKGAYYTDVSLDYSSSSLPFAHTALLPKIFVLKLAYESLDFVLQDTQRNYTNSKPILQFPYQNIICWGHSQQHFQFKVINNDKTSNDSDFNVMLLTSKGRQIERATMETVLLLMGDMKQPFVTTKEDFSALVKELFSGGALKENFQHTLEQFAANRTFTAKQGLDLMTLVSPHVPFERIDTAVFLYSKIINKDSYQLIINSFEHREERDNLLTRLRGKMQQERSAADVALLSGFSIDATLLPERAHAPL